jgi:hypothetical protein
VIQVFLNGEVIAEYDESVYYADPSGGYLRIRKYEMDELVEVFEPETWDEVR